MEFVEQRAESHKLVLRRTLKVHYIPETENKPCSSPRLGRMSTAHFPMYGLSLELPQVNFCYLQFSKPNDSKEKLDMDLDIS